MTPASPEPIRVALLTRSLQIGGTERQIAILATGLDRSRFRPAVFCFYSGGALADEVRRAGIDVVEIGKSARWDMTGFFRKLIRELRRFRPDVLYTFLPVPGVIGVLLKPFFPRTRLVWGIRAAHRSMAGQEWFKRTTSFLERLLSPLPDLIIANSEAAAEVCRRRHYPVSSLKVIPNGVDTERFRPDPASRERIRRELAVTADQFVIGTVGRIDADKDHETFVRAAALLHAESHDVRFVIVGGGDDPRRNRLEALAHSLGIAAITWTGPRSDIEKIDNAFDLFTSTSSEESLPNTIAEAMACGVPCVVTDAGDSRLLAGDTGVVVPPQSSEALAAGWKEMRARLLTDGAALRSAARARIVERYDSRTLLRNMETVLAELMDVV